MTDEQTDEFEGVLNNIGTDSSSPFLYLNVLYGGSVRAAPLDAFYCSLKSAQLQLMAITQCSDQCRETFQSGRTMHVYCGN